MSMADTVRCQMCGKLNSPDAEVCQHCNARLKPLIAGATGTAKPTLPEIPEASRDIPSEETPLEPSELSFDISDKSGPISEQTGAEESSLDWLSDFRSENKIGTSSLQPLDEAEALPPTGSLGTGPGGTEGHGSDWLRRLGGAEESSQEGIPRSLPVEERPSESLVGEELDHLPRVVPEGETDVSSAETDLAAWLAELDGGREEKSSVSEVAEVGAVKEAELPDRLIQVDGEQPVIPDAEATAEAEVGELPDWLKSMAEAQPPTAETETTTEVVPEMQELPNKRKGIGAEQPVVAEAQIESQPEEEELPDWLKSISAEPPQGLEAEAAGEAKAEEIKSSDWLTGIGEERSPISEAEVPQEAGAGETEQPDWLASIGEEQPLPSETGVMEKSVEGEGPGSQLPRIEVTPGELTPTELPGWLEAMRPEVEIIPADGTYEPTDSIMVSAGPLAGLHGVLSVQSIAAQVGKPPTPTLKMHLSRTQKEHVALLSKMLATEEDAPPVCLPKVIASQRLVRWGIAIILFFASLLPIVVGSQQMSLPVPPYEIQQVNQLVNGLAPETPVLLAFDYEPGLSGEMDAAASAVVDHLMVRGASLALVSTSPTGPVLAERFVQKIQVKHRYMSGQQYLNLGYIPGGSAGLLSFAGLPQRTLPYTIDGKRAWGNAPLQNVKKLSDFTLVVVIVDSPETARNWVEQIQPYLGATPLVMVISAQAEPMVRPYYEGNPRQIQGMVVGLSGGSAYERITGLESLGRAYWDAFGIELLLAVAIILVGAMVSFILLVLDWRKATSAGSTADSSSKPKGARERA